MVNGTLLNFGKRYEDTLRVIFDQWPKLHLGLDALSNQKTLISFSSCQRNLIKTFQIEGMIELITKMTLIFSSDL